jgi:ethanolamine utilization microcompartment shell protein EutS
MGQMGVTLSSSEAEYIAISEAIKENQIHLLFIERYWSQSQAINCCERQHYRCYLYA